MQQQLTVFLSLDTHEMLTRMRREGDYENDNHLILDALHALKREWQTGQEDEAMGMSPRQGSVRGSRPARDDEIFHPRASYSPEDFDT